MRWCIDFFDKINMVISMDFNKKSNMNLQKTPDEQDMSGQDPDVNGQKEMLYLTSIPGMKERLLEGKDAKIEDSEPFKW